MRYNRKLVSIVLILTMIFSCMQFGCAESVSGSTYRMPYYIEVDIANQITTVYNTADNSIVRQMICTTGLGNNKTPCGTYIMPEKKYEQDRQEWYYFPEFFLYAKYASRIVDGILFHSVLYKTKNSESPTWGSVHSLGSKASHGCIRLRVEDAKWIAENCMPGTQVRMFDDAEVNEELRKLLKICTYSVDGDVTYEEFCGGAVPLSKGVDLESVVTMQEKLNELGYDCGSADGDFGDNTEKAVLAWQKDYGYEETGEVTPEQLKALLKAEPTVTPTPSPTPDLSTIEGDKAVVQSKSSLNMRSAPDLNSEVVTMLAPGTEVTIVENDGGWTQIVAEGKLGYVDTSYLLVTATRRPTPTPVPTPTPEPSPEASEVPAAEAEETPEPIDYNGVSAVVKDINSGLNVRSEPSTDGTIIGGLNSGDTVTLTAVEGDWANIQLDDGTTGYVMFSYLDCDPDAAEELQEEEPEGTPMTVSSQDGLQLRREPSETGGIVTTLSDGAKVYVQEEAADGWVKVYAGGFNGYVMKGYLKEEEEEAS